MNKLIEGNNNDNNSEGNTSNSDSQENLFYKFSGAPQNSSSILKGDNINENGKRMKRRSKKEMYIQEREEIIKELFDVIKITNENKTFILYEIENSQELKNKIEELEERIKKCYKTGNWNYYIQRNNGELSPVIGLLRSIFRDNNIELTKKDISLTLDGKKIRTTKYYLMI
jgi:hypothetical protein